jgi:hypothetical protein
VYIFLLVNPDGRNPVGDISVDVKKILKWFLHNLDLNVWTELNYETVFNDGLL